MVRAPSDCQNDSTARTALALDFLSGVTTQTAWAYKSGVRRRDAHFFSARHRMACPRNARAGPFDQRCHLADHIRLWRCRRP